MERESDSSTVGQVEPKHLEISTEPLSLTATRRSKMVLVQADPNCLEFRPSKWSLFFDGIFVAVFLLLLVWDLFSSHYWLALLWALILVAEFFRIRAALGSWVRLDRNTNTLERRLDREFGPLITLAHLLIEGRDSVRRRLTNVIAIQLLKERFVFGLFQLNVVFDDPSGDRLNLCASRKLDAIRKMGHAIADFLSVPLLDQTQQEKPQG